MKLETVITDAWERRAAWLWLLLPLSWLYGLIVLLRRQAYKMGLLSSYKAPVPVMVIGNITVGGSGKTPLIITLVNYLQQRKVKVGVISRGYGGDSEQMPAIVTKSSLPSIVGDEPCLIVNMTAVPMAVCPDRKQAITTLLDAHPDLQLIIADDGLQHYALQRDIEWIVVDVARGFGNKQLLPTGFLREPITRLNEAVVVYHQKPTSVTKSNAQFNNIDFDAIEFDNIDTQLNHELSAKHLSMILQPDSLQPLIKLPEAKPVDEPKPNSMVHAVSGIGYPQRFFATLTTLGFEIIAHPYPDHHDFSLSELLQYTEHPIIVTSKDAVKIRALLIEMNTSNNDKDTPLSIATNDYQALINRLWVLPVTAVLSENGYQILQKQLKKLGI